MITLKIPERFNTNISKELTSNTRTNLVSTLGRFYGHEFAIVIASHLENSDVVQIGNEGEHTDIISLHVRTKKKGGKEYMVSINNKLHII